MANSSEQQPGQKRSLRCDTNGSFIKITRRDPGYFFCLSEDHGQVKVPLGPKSWWLGESMYMEADPGPVKPNPVKSHVTVTCIVCDLVKVT